MGLSIIHGGSGYPFFAPVIYQYVSGSTAGNFNQEV